MYPITLSACDIANFIKDGSLTAEETVKAFLAVIEEREPSVDAWTFLNADYVLSQAREADRVRREGRPLGPLHGVPVGLKDIIDTADMPTENGSILHAGRRPTEDATVVSLLRRAGAIIMGKTVTTEFAYYAPGKTKNPHNPAHTPGGSSSGSAAAVAARMVPLAVGTQTNGSVIRPASFCGVVGYKPTHGRISRHRVWHQSWHLDQIGVFAHEVEDAALIAQELMAFDGRDPNMHPFARISLREKAATVRSKPPRFAFVKSPVWSRADEEMRAGFTALINRMGNVVDEVTLPALFEDGVQFHRWIMEGDFALSFADLYGHSRNSLSQVLVEAIERGREVRAHEYNRAVESIAVLNDALDQIFEDYDAILTPASPGPAPRGLDTTGNPIFCTIWTLCGVPAVTLPLLKGANGLPMGVQVVAGKGQDGRLLRTAAWLEAHLGSTL